METGLMPFIQHDESDQHDDAFSDNWYEESSDGGFDASELNREREKRHNHFHIMGYRDGVIAGKETSAQEGFNVGLKQSVFVGYKWGLVRGVTSALASLPDCLKDKLARIPESRNRLGSLQEHVQSISTNDMLKTFHNNILLNGSEKSHNNPDRSCSAVGATDEVSGGDRLEMFTGELKSLLHEFPEVQMHLKV